MKSLACFTLFAYLLICPGLNALAAKDLKQPQSMFELYEQNREHGIGNYITTDFVLTASNLFVQDLVADLEKEVIAPAYSDLANFLIQKLQTHKDSPVQRLALASVAVPAKLLNPDFNVPKPVRAQVSKELKIIQDGQGIRPSAVFAVKEDFSQYIPRGKYTRSDEMKRYFQAMMYSGRMGFFLKASQATGVTQEMAGQHTQAALLLSRLITENQELLGLYSRLNELLTRIAGLSDDLTPLEFQNLAKQSDAEDVGRQVVQLLKEQDRLPTIIATPVDRTRLEQGVSAAEATASVKLLGQRSSASSQAFQNLVFDQVTTFQGQGQPLSLAVINGRQVRGFPRLYDIMAGLGSERALQMLQASEDTAYKGYDDQLQKTAILLKKTIHAPRSLPEHSLKLARLLLENDTETGLNAALGQWIQNRHTLILYLKQSMTILAKSIQMQPKRSTARVEPRIRVYDHLVELLYSLAEVTAGNPEIDNRLQEFRDVLVMLRAAAHKQEDLGLDAADCKFLNRLDKQFKRLLSGPDQPLVVDIHTEPNSEQVLEVGLGYPQVVHPETESELRGARYTCYEFKQPMDKRLTDKSWQEMLEQGEGKGLLK